LPLRIAYAFEPSVDREVLSTIGSSDDPTALFHLRLGRAARGAFERVFAASFVEAEDVTGKAPAQEATDGIIRLSLAAARMGSGENGYVASATFELIFLDPDGTQEGSWRVSGTGTEVRRAQHGAGDSGGRCGGGKRPGPATCDPRLARTHRLGSSRQHHRG